MVSEAEIRLLQALVLDHVARLALHHDASATHENHPPAGHHRARRTLLDDQQRQFALRSQRYEDFVHLIDDLGRKSERWLVDSHEAGRGHEGPADDEHLLLASPKPAGWRVAALGQHTVFTRY